MKDIRGLFALWAFSNKIKICRSGKMPYVAGLKTSLALMILGVMSLSIIGAPFLLSLFLIVSMLYFVMTLNLFCINSSENLLTQYILKNKDKFEAYCKINEETFYKYGNLQLCVFRFSDSAFVRVYIGSEKMNVFRDDFSIIEGSNNESISESLLNN